MPTVRHEGVRQVVAILNQSPAPIASVGQSYEARRAAMDGLGAAFPTAEGVEIAERTLAGRPCLVHTPPGAVAGAAILYLHGGGYCVGSPASHKGLSAMLAKRSGVRVYALDYRLAPEHPFPAAVEDGVAAVRALAGEGLRLALAGDSAGGGLALATALQLKAEGGPAPAALYLLSPWADLTQTAPAVTTQAAFDPMLTKEGLDQMAADYAGARLRDPLASPVFADLAGLAPMFIQVGSDEILLGDSAAIHAAAKGEGVDATLEVWPHMIHVFPAFFPLLAEGDRALTAGAAWLRERLV